MSLPNGYKRLEYIQSTGTQYVNTGITINATTYKSYRFLFDIGYPSIGGSYWLVNGNSGSNVIYYFGLSNTGSIVYGNGTADVNGSVTAPTGRYLVDFNPAGGSYKFGDLQHLTGLTFNAPSGSQNFYLFAYNKGNGQDMHTERLYSAKIYDNGTLVRDFIPCRTSDGTVGLWDNINSVLYTNAGTGAFIGGPLSSVSLPSGYRRLEYIQSSGTQYIDTGIVPKNNTRVDADCDITYGTDWIMILGSYDYNAYFSWWANASKIYAYYGSQNKSGNGVTGKQTMIANGSKWSASANSFVFSDASFTAHSTMYLFSVHNGGNSYANASMKLYSCQIYDNGTLVRDFVPCINASGEIGLFDMVNRQFYGNAGTGTFTAGPVVASPSIFVNIDGIWKPINHIYVNINNIWQKST